MSTIGVSPVTVIVSASAPTFMSALIVAVNEPVSSMPSRLTRAEAGQRERHGVGAGPQVDDAVLAGAVGHGGLRAFSISAGLDASTVTPGSTAPDASLTTPVMEAWANAAAGTSTRSSNAPNPTCNLRMHYLPSFTYGRTRTIGFTRSCRPSLHGSAGDASTVFFRVPPGFPGENSTDWMSFR